MQFDSYCSQCVLDRECKLAHKLLSPEDAHRHILECMTIIAGAPKGVAAPYLVMLMRKNMARYGITQDLYAREKQESNDYILAVLPEARSIVEKTTDPLMTAMKFAQAGNFLDFGVLTQADVDEKIQKAIADAPDAPLDPEEFSRFIREVGDAKELLIIGDNAGEIVFDLLLVEQLQKHFPALDITYSVRGGNCLNDATREDARYVGMDRLVSVIDNGCNISGTEFSAIGNELLCAIERADVILAKGQANFETMVTCGYNVYYNFMCKCDRLARILNVPLYTGMFLAERRLDTITPFPR